MGLNGGNTIRNPPPEYPPAVLSEDIGLVAVDRATGDPIGYLPLGDDIEATILLGWGGDDPSGPARPRLRPPLDPRRDLGLPTGALYPLAMLPTLVGRLGLRALRGGGRGRGRGRGGRGERGGEEKGGGG